MFSATRNALLIQSLDKLYYKLYQEWRKIKQNKKCYTANHTNNYTTNSSNIVMLEDPENEKKQTHIQFHRGRWREKEYQSFQGVKLN